MSRSPRDQYERLPAPSFFFERRRPFGGAETDRSTTRLEAGHEPGQRIRMRSERIGLSTTEIGALTLELGPHSFVDIAGADTDTYSIEFRVEVAAATDDLARDLTESITLRRKGATFLVSNPTQPGSATARSLLQVIAPWDRPVTITGDCSEVTVSDVTAPVRISGRHGRFNFLNTGGDIDAIAEQGGLIVFAGDRGRVSLVADGELFLRMTSETFAGRLQGTAGGPVRALIPVGFRSTLELVASQDSCFVCRANLRSQRSRTTADGMMARVFGSGEPVVRLVSLASTVVVDSVETAQLATPPAR